MRTYSVLIALLAVVVAFGLTTGSEVVVGHAVQDVHLATVYQQPYDQTEAFAVADNGAVRGVWKTSGSPWLPPFNLTPPGFAPPGAPIAAVFQPLNNQVEVFVVGNDGTVWDIWKANNGAWQPPLKLTGPNVAPAGAGIAAVSFANSRLEVVVVGRDGALWAISKANNGPWNSRAVTRPNIAREGAPLAAVYFPRLDEVDVFVAGGGAVSAIRMSGAGVWQQPETLPHPPSIGPTWVPIGAPLAAIVNPWRDIPQDAIFDRLEVFVVGNDGAVWEIWKDGFNRWQTPGKITDSDFASSRAPLAAVDDPLDDDLQVFVVDKNGALQGISKKGRFPPLAGALTDPKVLRDGTPLAALYMPFQTEVLYVDDTWALGGVWKSQTTAWSKPVPLTAAGLAPFYTPQDCMKWYQRWRRGGLVQIGDDRLEEQCLWIMGVQQFCRAHHAFVAVEYDATGRRSHFKCAEYAYESTFLEELEHLITGIGQGLETAFVAAAPYFGLVVSGVACVQGVLFACAALALDAAALAGAQVPAEARQALGLVEQIVKCVNYNISACAQAGVQGAQVADVTLPIPGLDVAEVAADTQQCYNKVYAACMRLGLAAAEAAGVSVGAGPSDIADVQDCLNGDNLACLALGHTAAKATGFPLGGVAQGVENARTCAAGDTAACIALGTALVGSALPQGFEHARRCANNDTNACIELGKVLAGSRVAQGAQNARRCKDGDVIACSELGKAVVGSGLPKGAENIRRCAAGETNACIELGKALVAGSLAQDAEKARRCANNDTNACIELGRALAQAAGLGNVPNAMTPLEGRPAPNPAPGTGAAMTRPELRQGSSGPAVRELQTLLGQHGFSVAVDGDFGPQTAAAVRAFQKVKGLEVDGIVGPQTWSALLQPPVPGLRGPELNGG